MFSVVYHGGISEHKSFYFHRKESGYHHFFSKLIGIKLGSKEIMPIFSPILTVNIRQHQLYAEIHLSRWKSLFILIGRKRFNIRYLDLRKDYEQDHL